VKIYTGIGDKGTTSILGATKIPKNDSRIEAYGSIDELNSHVGLLATLDKMKDFATELRIIQNHLFNIGSELAATPEALPKLKLTRVTADDISDLEKSIDIQTVKLPELKSFILPGSCTENANCHIARTVCRRAERAMVNMNQTSAIHPDIMVYINRLSDYLFTLSRSMTQMTGTEEIEWNSTRR
jgi:cob(I)alamin adenosyltransferase